MKCVTFENVDKALLVWFPQKSVLPNLRLLGDMLLMEAKEFANDFGYKEEDTELSVVNLVGLLRNKLNREWRAN